MAGGPAYGGALVVVATAGYGKTTALRRWFPGDAHWYDAVRFGDGELLALVAAPPIR
jgi:hypothetical protein